MIAWHGWSKLVRLAGGDSGFVDSVGKMGFPMRVVFAWAAVLAETRTRISMASGPSAITRNRGSVPE
jgi:uncharacterized membrane protein YphA (DoxX/SURF4 family)